MDLTDIFGKPPKKITSEDVVASLRGIPSPIQEQAKAAAKAFDRLLAAKTLYDAAQERLQVEMSTRLRNERVALEAAQSEFEALKELLKAEMEHQGVTEIPLEDRRPVVIKLTPGKKRSITLTWLTDTLGKKPAQEIWEKVPCYDGKTEVVIPPPYKDEPTL